MNNYCFEDAGQVLNKLKTSRSGLSPEEAAKRLSSCGKNLIESEKRAGILKLFFSQFKDLMTLLLIAAAAVSGIIAFFSKDRNDLTDTFIILFIILMNAVVGTVQQFRADKAIENLRKLSASFCKVRRGDKEFVIPCEELTIGDIVLLEEGDVVPADCRVIESNGIKCDESALTGESVSVEKSTERIRDNKVSLGGMTNTLFGSTYIVSGNGSAVVTAVGMNTEMGKIADMLKGGKKIKTPLENSLDKLGKIISAFVLAVTCIIFGVGMFVRDDGLLKNFMTAVAVAVAAIPEGLPAVVTIIMATGVQKMSKKGVIIRKLKSVETLGGCTVICTDKTGTLTQNRLKVTQTEIFSDAAKNRLLQCMSVCNGVKGQKGAYLGDPTEIALRIYADECDYGVEFTRLGELPFDSERKMMSVTADIGGEKLQFTKGAPDILIGRCDKYLAADGVKPLTEDKRREITEKNNAMSDDGLRVLGFAYKPCGGEIAENKLIFTGLCGMKDGLKDGVEAAVAECRRAGVSTVMITGDHVRTAFSIAKKLGIAESMDEVMTGAELDAIPKAKRGAAIEKCRVFARVSPKHKNIIVNALQKKGHVVAMTGDGINDAPSIKSADIGISMGISGTDVTKSASDMVISDDNFATIVSAVREGRRLSDNIKKTIRFFVSTNLAEVLAILIASLILFRFNFLLSTQLLWLNLITDSMPVLALGMEKSDCDLMGRPPERAEKGLFSKRSIGVMLSSGVFIASVTIAVFMISLNLWGNEAATTVTFMTISFMELLQAFNVRTEGSVFGKGALSNKMLLLTVALGVALNVILCVSPLSSAFGLVALGVAQWGLVAASSLSIIVLGEIYKIVFKLYIKKKRKK